MDKRKRNIIIGIILLILTIQFTMTNRFILFNSVLRSGGTFIQLRASDSVNLDSIKQNISEIIYVDKTRINISNTSGGLEVRLDLLEDETINLIVSSLMTEFGDNIEFTGYQNMGKSTISVNLYIIYFALITSLLLSIFILVRNIQMLVKEHIVSDKVI